ncbi:MAG: hypothetical protein QM791_04295 [Ferruginibacter sp.]
MKKYMPELAEHKERIACMQEAAAKVEETKYQKPLSEDELAARRESLADDCIKLNQLEDELKEVKDEYKDKMDPLKLANKKRLEEIKTKQTTVDGVLYHIPDFEESMMETYDGEGELVSSRRLRPEEKQGNVFQMAKVS